MKTKNIPIAANKQKYFNAGKIVVAPIAKASKSVTEVIVIATPALRWPASEGKSLFCSHNARI